MQAFSSSVSGGYSLVVVYRLLIAVASLVAEHGLQGARTSVVRALRLTSYSAQGLVALKHVGIFPDQ